MADWHLWRRWPRAWGWFHIAGGLNAFVFSALLNAGVRGGELDWVPPWFAALMGTLMLGEGILKLWKARGARLAAESNTREQRPRQAYYDVRTATLTVGGRTVPLRRVQIQMHALDDDAATNDDESGVKH